MNVRSFARISWIGAGPPPGRAERVGGAGGTARWTPAKIREIRAQLQTVVLVPLVWSSRCAREPALTASRGAASG
eukprot:8599130-Pyramimonas_sp.AAC.1